MAFGGFCFCEFWCVLVLVLVALWMAFWAVLAFDDFGGFADVDDFRFSLYVLRSLLWLC